MQYIIYNFKQTYSTDFYFYGGEKTALKKKVG